MLDAGCGRMPYKKYILEKSGVTEYVGLDIENAKVYDKNIRPDFTWDGKTTLGGQLEDGGVYTLKVTAKDAAGETIDSQVLVRGQVTGVELYNGEPYLTLGASILPLSSVIALNQMGAGAEPDPESDPEAQGLMARVASALNPMNLF